MNNKQKKIALVLVIIVAVLSLAVYFSSAKNSNNGNSSKSPTENVKTEQQKAEEKKIEENLKITKDTIKTENLKKEQAVLDGQVYVQNNVATATMIIKDDISEADAKVLAEKYAKQLKEQYKDMKVNVQAVQKGKNIANITK